VRAAWRPTCFEKQLGWYAKGCGRTVLHIVRGGSRYPVRFRLRRCVGYPYRARGDAGMPRASERYGERFTRSVATWLPTHDSPLARAVLLHDGQAAFFSAGLSPRSLSQIRLALPQIDKTDSDAPLLEKLASPQRLSSSEREMMPSPLLLWPHCWGGVSQSRTTVRTWRGEVASRTQTSKSPRASSPPSFTSITGMLQSS